MFHKQVNPILDNQDQPSGNMSKEIEIPIASNSQYSRVKDVEEGSSFMSDSLWYFIFFKDEFIINPLLVHP